MTARFLALYEKPADPETFDRHYREVHIPLLRQLPGLRRYTVGRDVTALHGAPCYLVTEFEWDTMDELRAAFASPRGPRDRLRRGTPPGTRPGPQNDLHRGRRRDVAARFSARCGASVLPHATSRITSTGGGRKQPA
jgi:uncharacterized protein (TIGR02118 family)